MDADSIVDDDYISMQSEIFEEEDDEDDSSHSQEDSRRLSPSSSYDDSEYGDDDEEEEETVLLQGEEEDEEDNGEPRLRAETPDTTGTSYVTSENEEDALTLNEEIIELSDGDFSPRTEEEDGSYDDDDEYDSYYEETTSAEADSQDRSRDHYSQGNPSTGTTEEEIVLVMEEENSSDGNPTQRYYATTTMNNHIQDPPATLEGRFVVQPADDETSEELVLYPVATDPPGSTRQIRTDEDEHNNNHSLEDERIAQQVIEVVEGYYSGDDTGNDLVSTGEIQSVDNGDEEFILEEVLEDEVSPPLSAKEHTKGKVSLPRAMSEDEDSTQNSFSPPQPVVGTHQGKTRAASEDYEADSLKLRITEEVVEVDEALEEEFTAKKIHTLKAQPQEMPTSSRKPTATTRTEDESTEESFTENYDTDDMLEEEINHHQTADAQHSETQSAHSSPHSITKEQHREHQHPESPPTGHEKHPSKPTPPQPTEHLLEKESWPIPAVSKYEEIQSLKKSPRSPSSNSKPTESLASKYERELQYHDAVIIQSAPLAILQSSPLSKPSKLPQPRKPEESDMHKLIDQKDWKGLLQHMGELKEKPSSVVAYELTKIDKSVNESVVHRIVVQAPFTLTKLLLSMIPFDKRNEILLLTDAQGNTALHLACANLKLQPHSHTVDGTFLETLALGGPYAHELQNLNGDIPLSLLLTSPAMKANTDSNLVSLETQAEDLVRRIITDHPDLVSVQNHQKQTLLHIGATCGIHERVLLYLLDSFEPAASILDKTGRLPLHYVAAGVTGSKPPVNFAERLLFLAPHALTTPCSLGNTPLHYLIKSISLNVTNKEDQRSFGLEQLIKCLLGGNENDASSASPLLVQDEDGKSPFHCCAALRTPIHLTRILTSHSQAKNACALADHQDSTPFHMLCGSPDIANLVEHIKLLGTEESGIKRDALGRTPMLVATENPHCTIGAMQATIEACHKAARISDPSGKLPFHVAMRQNPKDEFIKAILLANPKAVKATVDGENNILHDMCQHKMPATLVQLILHMYPEGAQMANKYENIPLHIATFRQCDYATIKALVKAYPEGCSRKNKDKDVPLHYATRYKMHPEVIDLLVQADPASAMIPNAKDITPMEISKANGTSDIMVQALDRGIAKKRERKDRKKINGEASVSQTASPVASPKPSTTKVRSKASTKGASSPKKERKRSKSRDKKHRTRSKSRDKGEEGKSKKREKTDEAKKSRGSSKSREKSDNRDSETVKSSRSKKLSKSMADLNYAHRKEDIKIDKRSKRGDRLSASLGNLNYNESGSGKAETKAKPKRSKSKNHRSSHSLGELEDDDLKSDHRKDRKKEEDKKGARKTKASKHRSSISLGDLSGEDRETVDDKEEKSRSKKSKASKSTLSRSLRALYSEGKSPRKPSKEKLRSMQRSKSSSMDRGESKSPKTKHSSVKKSKSMNLAKGGDTVPVTPATAKSKRKKSLLRTPSSTGKLSKSKRRSNKGDIAGLPEFVSSPTTDDGDEKNWQSLNLADLTPSDPTSKSTKSHRSKSKLNASRSSSKMGSLSPTKSKSSPKRKTSSRSRSNKGGRSMISQEDSDEAPTLVQSTKQQSNLVDELVLAPLHQSSILELT